MSMDHPRGEAEWKEKRDEIVAQINEFEQRMGPLFRAWEQARFDLAEWDKKRPNAPESPHS